MICHSLRGLHRGRRFLTAPEGRTYDCTVLGGDLLLSDLVRRAVPHMARSHVEDLLMSRKRHKPEEIVAKLRQVEVLTAHGRTVAEAIRSIGVTKVSSGTSCSTARSSPRSRRPRSSSRAGVATTTPFDRTRRSATSRPRQRSYCGRLRFPDQLRRPPQPWRHARPCTNIRPGPPNGGRPRGHGR